MTVLPCWLAVELGVAIVVCRDAVVGVLGALAAHRDGILLLRTLTLATAVLLRC